MEQAANHGPAPKNHSGARARRACAADVRIPASRPQRAGQRSPMQRMSESAWCGRGPAVAAAAAVAEADARVGPVFVRYCHSCMPRDQVHLACARRQQPRHIAAQLARRSGRAWGPTLHSLDADRGGRRRRRDQTRVTQGEKRWQRLSRGSLPPLPPHRRLSGWIWRVLSCRRRLCIQRSSRCADLHVVSEGTAHKAANRCCRLAGRNAAPLESSARCGSDQARVGHGDQARVGTEEEGGGIWVYKLARRFPQLRPPSHQPLLAQNRCLLAPGAGNRRLAVSLALAQLPPTPRRSSQAWWCRQPARGHCRSSSSSAGNGTCSSQRRRVGVRWRGAQRRSSLPSIRGWAMTSSW